MRGGHAPPILSHRLKLGLAAGALGVATLVGTGAMSLLAGAEQGNQGSQGNSPQYGTLHLQAIDLKASVYDPAPPGVTQRRWNPMFTPGVISVKTVDGTSVIKVSQAHADPTATYTYSFRPSRSW